MVGFGAGVALNSVVDTRLWLCLSRDYLVKYCK